MAATGLILIVLAIVFVLSIIQAGFYAVIALCEFGLPYMLFLFIWGIVCICLETLSSIYKIKYEYHPTLRTICHISTGLFFACTIIFVIMFLITQWNNIEEPPFQETFLGNILGHSFWGNSFFIKYPIKTFLILVISIRCIAILFNRTIADGERIYYLTVPKVRYNLFLRSFHQDKQLEIDKDIATAFPNYKLVEIADPTTTHGNTRFQGKNLFLPTSMWKRELSYYISRANLVFCCIGSSDGVKWEMFENDKYMGKYVYYIDSTTSFCNIVFNANKQHTNSQMFRIFKQLQRLDDKRPFYFVIKNSTCYYSNNLFYIASLLNDNIIHPDLKTYELNINNNLVVNKLEDKRESYLFKDIIRIFNIFLRPASFAYFFIFIFKTILTIFSLALTLLGVSLMLSGFGSLLSIIFPSLDIFESTTVLEKLKMFSIIIPGYIITSIGICGVIHLFKPLNEKSQRNKQCNNS